MMGWNMFMIPITNRQRTITMDVIVISLGKTSVLKSLYAKLKVNVALRMMAIEINMSIMIIG